MTNALALCARRSKWAVAICTLLAAALILALWAPIIVPIGMVLVGDAVRWAVYRRGGNRPAATAPRRIADSGMDRNRRAIAAPASTDLE